jgi:hypothetical protein
MKRLHIITGLFLIAVSAFCQGSGDFETETINGTIIVTGYTGAEKNVRIPSKIHGMPVTAIGYFAFAEKQLTGVHIPDSVTSIEDGAFYDNRIQTITIPRGVTAIGMAAFSHNNITGVTIPNTVTHIGISAFSDNRIKHITLPNRLTSIENGVFSDNEIISVTIPNSVRTIGMYAFYNNRITNVRLPDSVTSIGDYAFSSATRISIADGIAINEQSVSYAGFSDFYNKKGKSAGTYRVDLVSGKWSFAPKLHIILMGTDERFPVEI